MKFFHLLSLHIFAPLYFLFGQQVQDDTYAFSDKVSALKLKSAAHEKEIAKLLSSTSLQPTNFVVPVPESTQPILPSVNSQPEVPPAPYLPVPDYYEVKELTDTPAPQAPVVENDIAATMLDADSIGGIDLNNTDTLNSDDPKPVPEIVFQRHDGYYFGPLLGFTIPDDGAVRDAGGAGKIPYESDTGYFLGLQFGKDFGTVRWEVEYSHQGYDSQGVDFSGLNYDFEVGIHSFATRLLLEKEIGDLIDLRAGLGMGVGFISLESNSDYSGESFIYDFGIGASYRFRENVSLALDYRFFLSAAEDRYDRINSHIFTASAQFDL
jgi:hypothetical protein